ncbi:protein phosphatase 2C [Bacillus cereus group sp. BfR-BA-01523]|uniref:protein phosphatase 2C n=1 Tax=Bacillus cereus group sp. BfR-BA-01523 TaxID=2920371 RepID=UPI001F57E737|nr:protein phosphatase 2C [Bacillus cereus group sp. BfR-BA-01523]
MENMLKKLKKFMIVAAAAVMLSVGFATVAPQEASAHWADPEMNWAMNRGYITADLRDSLATRQDMWLIITRVDTRSSGYSYNTARNYVINQGISDGSRGTNWITRSEAAAMVLNMRYQNIKWDPEVGFYDTDRYAKFFGFFDGTRGNDFATRAEVISMLFRAKWTH